MDMRQIDSGTRYVVINSEREMVAIISTDSIVTKDGYEVLIEDERPGVSG